MGLTTSEKAEFSTYQFKDVSQDWYVKLRENRPLRGKPMTWEVFKKVFLYILFPREINLHQGRINVIEYSLKLTKLSKYAPSFVCDLGMKSIAL